MIREDFLKKLKQNLSYLKKKERDLELLKYESMQDVSHLDPVEEANKIYASRNLDIRITSNVKFLKAFKTILDRFKNKDLVGITIWFFIKIFLIVIIIKIPFIYVRDMVSTLFSITEDNAYMIFNLIIELIYAITCIMYIIKAIKKESMKNMETK